MGIGEVENSLLHTMQSCSTNRSVKAYLVMKDSHAGTGKTL